MTNAYSEDSLGIEKNFPFFVPNLPSPTIVSNWAQFSEKAISSIKNHEIPTYWYLTLEIRGNQSYYLPCGIHQFGFFCLASMFCTPNGFDLDYLDYQWYDTKHYHNDILVLWKSAYIPKSVHPGCICSTQRSR